MSTDCSDICERVHEQLVGLGFKISEDEDYEDIKEALDQCTLIRNDELKKLREMASGKPTLPDSIKEALNSGDGTYRP